MTLINTIYSEPTPEQLQEALSIGKTYKVTYHNGKISHWQLVKIPEKKEPCSCCGKRIGTTI
jgi:hypothetical protein